FEFDKLEQERDKAYYDLYRKYPSIGKRNKEEWNKIVQGEDTIYKYYENMQFKIAKNQVEIEKCMFSNGMLNGQEKEIVKYNIQQIADGNYSMELYKGLEYLKLPIISQPSTIVSPESTFIEKLLEKRYQRQIVNKQVSANNTIPVQYLKLLELEIFLEDQKNSLELHIISEVFQRHPCDKLFIADETTKKVAGSIHLDSYKYISKPQCLKNAVGETLIDFFDLTNFLATEIAESIVNKYYNHTLSNPSHQSDQFAKDLIEHFGCFTDSNNEPYVTANTASTHCQEHQKCVKKLIQELQPISDTLAVKAKQGQAIAFQSHLLVHGNLPIIAGIRHSIVFYIHRTMIKQRWKFGSLFDDYDSNIEENSSKKRKKLQKYAPPKLDS
ncbi:36020_t:CDS:2, partial [Gigaspora margarita]